MAKVKNSINYLFCNYNDGSVKNEASHVHSNYSHHYLNTSQMSLERIIHIKLIVWMVFFIVLS